MVKFSVGLFPGIGVFVGDSPDVILFVHDRMELVPGFLDDRRGSFLIVSVAVLVWCFFRY